MSHQKKRAEVSRQAILAAAEKCFLEHGFAETSVDRILEEAGVSRATVFTHFGSKENLFKEVCNAIGTRQLPVLNMSADFFSGLEDFLIRYADAVLLPSSLAMHRLAIVEGRRYPSLADGHYKQGMGKIIPSVEKYLETGIEKKLVRDENRRVLSEQVLKSSLGYRQYRALLGVKESSLIPTAEYVRSAILGILTTAGTKKYEQVIARNQAS